MTPRRFLPPFAGGAQKTGWEALDKWVGGAADKAEDAAEAVAEKGKTGWEALEKWVGGGGGGSDAAAESAAPAASAA